MLVSIEGNVGCGKSSVLAALKAGSDGWLTSQEPIEEWGELLDLYYADPATWSLAFNLKVLHSFATIPASVLPGSTRVVERSPTACRHVFGQLAYNDNHLVPAAWEVFKEYHEMLGWEPDVYIYIDAPAATCLERIAARGRACETGIDLEYLARIEKAYENLMRFTKVPVFRVDGTRPPGIVEAEITSILAKLTV